MRGRPDEVFLYRLALELDIDQVEAWKRRISVRQIKKWMAYWRIEPFGDQWRRTARAALAAAKAAGARVEPEAEEQFLPSYREKPQTIDDIRRELAKIPAFARQMEQ